MNHKELLFGFLRSVVCGGQVTEEMKNACTEETLAQVYKLAAHHDLAHLVGQAISKLSIAESEGAKKCKNAAMVAFYRYTQIQYEYQRICDLLEKEQIPFIPLKGSVLREYYPESWMRTSCDIDILVTPEILETAAKALTEQLGYERKGKGDHDISLFAATGVHLELHYCAVDEGRMPQAQKVLAGIWEDATSAPGKQYHKCMSDQMFYFYHLAHMAKHFENGLTLEDGYETKPAGIRLEGDGNQGYITLVEGKYHQIKRMLEALDNKITYLERVSFGPLTLDGSLERGEWRYLTDEEIAALEAHA